MDLKQVFKILINNEERNKKLGIVSIKGVYTESNLDNIVIELIITGKKELFNIIIVNYNNYILLSTSYYKTISFVQLYKDEDKEQLYKLLEKLYSKYSDYSKEQEEQQ